MLGLATAAYLSGLNVDITLTSRGKSADDIIALAINQDK